MELKPKESETEITITNAEMERRIRERTAELEKKNEELSNLCETLQDSEKKYRDIVDTALVGVYTSSAKGVIHYLNNTIVRMFEYGSAEEFISDGALARYKDPKVRERFIKTLKEKGEVESYELELLTRTGKTINVLISCRLSGELFSGTIVDITERKRAEEEIRRYSIELKRSNEELQQFAYIASHDLQEPLRMVSSYVQLIEQRYKNRLDKDADEFIAFAVDGANRMREMINGLLEYSRVGTHGKPFAATSCEDLFENVIANLQIAIEENSAVITHDPLPVVSSDDVQLTQVFQNLISNAIKFRKKEQPPHIHISARQEGREWSFSFQDNGIGIEPQYKESLFIMFKQVHGRKEYPGTGIGLSICKRIVERHGGRIWVESEHGRGSTFYFTIPI